jgi:hypothetical protein
MNTSYINKHNNNDNLVPEFLESCSNREVKLSCIALGSWEEETFIVLIRATAWIYIVNFVVIKYEDVMV